MAQDNEKLTTSTIVESLDESHSSARRAPKEKPREESSMLVAMAKVLPKTTSFLRLGQRHYRHWSREVDIKSHHRETNLLTSLNVSDKPGEKPGNVFRWVLINNSNEWSVPGKSGVQCERILVSNDIVQAGQLKFCIKQWKTITCDSVILDMQSITNLILEQC